MSGRLDQFGQRRDVVWQIGDKVFVVLAFDLGRIIDRTDVLANVVNVAVDRLLERCLIGIGGRQRFGRLLGRLLDSAVRNALCR